MNVNVTINGVLGNTGPGQNVRLDLALHDQVTAGDLFRILAEQCGAPFEDALASSGARLPRHIRMFSDGEMIASLEQPLVAAPGSGASVNVVVLTPMMGG